MAVIEIPGYGEFERVGAGASGIVYRAHQLAFGDRVVAVKVIPDSDVDETTARRFRRECLGAGKLSWHPNVVSVYDAGVTDDGLAYLVMEYLEAGSLADRLRSKGAIPWHQAVDLTIKIAGALAAAHRAGLVHRDVKPENILVGPFGEPKLGDFGIAFIEGRSRSRTGSISGTIAHSAPEALTGNATESADIYALGSTLFMLLAGRPAFVIADDQSITPLITRIATAEVPDLRPRGVPDSLAGVIERTMAKEPDDRWSTADTLGEALQEVQRREGQTVTPLLIAPEQPAPPARSSVGPIAPARVAPPPDRPEDAVAIADGDLDGEETVTLPVGLVEATPVPSAVAAEQHEVGAHAPSADPVPEAADGITAGRPLLPSVAIGVVVLVVLVIIGLVVAKSDDPDIAVDPVASGVVRITGSGFPSNLRVQLRKCTRLDGGTFTNCTAAETATTNDDGNLDTNISIGTCATGTDQDDVVVVRRLSDLTEVLTQQTFTCT